MKRLRIDRIELHVRNVSPATAKDAAHLLGPALVRALGSQMGRLKTAAAESNDVDAGQLAIGAATDAPGLATGIAQRIAAKTTKD